jgi:hypothetical protein
MVVGGSRYLEVVGGSRYLEVVVSSALTVQAALAIRGFSIRGFHYARTLKPRKTREN